MNDISFDTAKAIFLDYCRAKNLSPTTVRWYDFSLKRIVDVLEKQYPGITPEQVTTAQLRDCVSQLIDMQLSTTSINNSLTAIKTFFKFLAEDSYIDDNPAFRVEKLRGKKTLIQPFSDEQIEELLKQPNTLRFAGVRDRAILLLLFDTGLRIHEALNIELGNIDWRSSAIKVLGKGRKERIVPFGRSVRQALRIYLDRRGNLPTEKLFVTEFGDPLQVRIFQEGMSRYGSMAGITGVRVSPHTCRHTFAVNFIRNGGDPFALQRILGHSTLEIVKLYMNLADEDILRSHRNNSPMDRLTGAAIKKTGRHRLK